MSLASGRGAAPGHARQECHTAGFPQEDQEELTSVPQCLAGLLYK